MHIYLYIYVYIYIYIYAICGWSAQFHFQFGIGNIHIHGPYMDGRCRYHIQNNNHTHSLVHSLSCGCQYHPKWDVYWKRIEYRKIDLNQQSGKIQLKSKIIFDWPYFRRTNDDDHGYAHTHSLSFTLVLSRPRPLSIYYMYIYISIYFYQNISCWCAGFWVFFPQPNNTDFKFVLTIVSIKLICGDVGFHAIFSTNFNIYIIIKLPSQILPLCIYIYQYEVVSFALTKQYVSLFRVAIKESRNVIWNCLVTLFTDLAVINTGGGGGECLEDDIMPKENGVFFTENLIFGPD